MAGSTAQEIINDWINVDQAFAQPYSTGQQLGFPIFDFQYRFFLMIIRQELIAGMIGIGLFDCHRTL